jgi:hypothetical protein
VFFVLWLIVVLLLLGKNSSAAKINNNKNNKMWLATTIYKYLQICDVYYVARRQYVWLEKLIRNDLQLKAPGVVDVREFVCRDRGQQNNPVITALPRFEIKPSTYTIRV